ncbi:hypothetical protein SODG_000423 [Sodalis praecaptivus]
MLPPQPRNGESDRAGGKSRRQDRRRGVSQPAPERTRRRQAWPFLAREKRVGGESVRGARACRRREQTRSRRQSHRQDAPQPASLSGADALTPAKPSAGCPLAGVALRSRRPHAGKAIGKMPLSRRRSQEQTRSRRQSHRQDAPSRRRSQEQTSSRRLSHRQDAPQPALISGGGHRRMVAIRFAQQYHQIHQRHRRNHDKQQMIRITLHQHGGHRRTEQAAEGIADQ